VRIKHGISGRQVITRAGATPASALIAALVPPVVEGVARLRRAGDAGAVHVLRVALARLRVALWLFPDAIVDRGDEALDAELKWLRRLSAPLRDWDVFIAACRGIAPLDGAPQAMAALLERAAADRAQAFAKIHKRLGGARCRRLLLRLRVLRDSVAQAAGAVDQSALPLAAARARLKPLLAKVRRRGRRIDRLDDAQLHRLRIRLRRPRYACELLHEHCDGARSKAYRKALARLHTRLGAIQDTVIGKRMVAVVREQDDDPEIHAATRAVLAQLRRNAKRRRGQLAEAWRTFNTVPPFWKPASA
jgi:CHAD domain-containing protein